VFHSCHGIFQMNSKEISSLHRTKRDGVVGQSFLGFQGIQAEPL
jgi:hypothetical protein